MTWLVALSILPHLFEAVAVSPHHWWHARVRQAYDLEEAPQLDLKHNCERTLSHYDFKHLGQGAFYQHGFRRFNLQRLTSMPLFSAGMMTESSASSTVVRTSKSKYSSSSFPDSTRVRSRMSLMRLSSESADQGLAVSGST
jgi:hypothetical protein